MLTSEVIDIPAILKTIQAIAKGHDGQSLIDYMHSEHLSPEEVGKLATEAAMNMVVLTHFAGPEGPDTTGCVTGVRRFFKGAVVAAQDLDAVCAPLRVTGSSMSGLMRSF